MTWSGARVRRITGSAGRQGSGGLRASWPRPSARRRARWAVALAGVQALAASCLTPAAGVLAGAAAITAASVAVASAPAEASLSGSVLILSTSVNGGSSSTEAQQATALGLTVTVATPSTWDAMTQAQFAAYNAIVIGDPSGASCSSTVPSDALSTAGTWGAAVTGNVAVLGTAPALGGATTLISDAIAYAASGGTGKTGLYVSLNCENASASDGTDVPLLASVEGGGFTVTGQGSHCPSDAGTVNTWQALEVTQFNGLTSAKLGPWSSPACSVEETFNAWPPALGGLAYYKGASPASFTASDGATGQAYILAGSPASAATAALAPSTGGQTPAGATTGGDNPAAPGVNQATAADPVNTENGDFTETATDISIPTFGPSLDFTRAYDAQAAQAQTVTGKPGPLGYGWTDNWATSLTGSLPVPGDMYTIDGLATAGASGGATQVPLDYPQTTIKFNGDIYIADTAGNRIEEVPAASGTQWGIAMTAGNMYTIAGSPTGNFGRSQDGTPDEAGVNGATSPSLLLRPANMAIDPSGNLFIADTGNNRVVEIPKVSGQNRGNGTMTVNDMYTIAGNPGGTAGHCCSGNNAAQNSFLNDPVGLSFGSGNADLYIADAGNNRVEEIPAAGGTHWGQSMTANNIYTVAGDPNGTAGRSGNGTALASSLLTTPEGIGTSSTGDLYIADTGNNRIVEAASSGGSQWGITMTANKIYTVAGNVNGTVGTSGDGGASTAAFLNGPTSVICANSTQLYIADSGNNRIQEAAHSDHTEWGTHMLPNDIYTIAGAAGGSSGFSGDGGAATSALLNNPGQVTWTGDLYIADTNNNRVRTVSGSTAVISEFAGTGQTLASAGNGGPAINGELYKPAGQAEDPQGNIYVADSGNNRIVEIASSTHSQWGFNLTAGHVSTIAGSAKGDAVTRGAGGGAAPARLSDPTDVAIDSQGNLFIADSGNNRIQEVSAATGNISTYAGSATGTAGLTGDTGLATAALLSNPIGVDVDTQGDVYVADLANNRIQEIYASGGHSWGITMTAGHIYTVAGSATGTSGHTGDGGLATSAFLNNPQGVATDAAGNLYIADSGNNRIQEVAVTTGIQRQGPKLTANDIYTVAGPSGTTCNSGCPSGFTGDAGPAKAALLNSPSRIAADAAGNLYIGDGSNRRIQEVPATDGTQWGQQMQANYSYTVAGSATGIRGESGDGGPATAALMSYAQGISVDQQGNLYIADMFGDLLREVVSNTNTPFPVYPTPGSTIGGATYPGGVTITHDNGSQATFYPKPAVGCANWAYTTTTGSGQYCTLPENTGSNLSFSSGTYTYTPQPGVSYAYNSAGQLTGETSTAGDTLTVAYGTPLPGQGNCPAGASWCQLITSAGSRALTIGYNASNLITSVTDPMGRTWTFAYTSFDLTSVSDPMSPANVTTYSYGAGSTGNPLNANNLLTITSPNAQPGGPDVGDSTVNTYDATGRVTKQTDPMGYQTQFAYNVDPSTGTGTGTVTDPDGNTTTDAYNQGTLTAESQWAGGTTLTSEQDYVPDQAAASGDNSAGTQLDTILADGDGNITTATYNSSGDLLTSSAPDGEVSSGGGTQLAVTTQAWSPLQLPDCSSDTVAAATCQQNPPPAPVTHGQAITPPSQAPPAGDSWTLYDDLGNDLYTTTGVYEPGSNTAAYAQTTYQLYKNNTVVVNGNAVSCSNNNPPSLSLPCATVDADGVVTQLAYNSFGDLTSTSTPDGNGSETAKTTYAYNGDGRQNSSVSPDGNLAGANAGNYTTVTTYGADQQVTAVTEAGGSGATVTPRATNYGYDANGNQTSVQDPRGYTTSTAYNADDQPVLVTDPDGNATLTCYDGDGNAAQVVPPVGVAGSSLTASSCSTSYPAGYSSRLAPDATVDTFNGVGEKTQETTPLPAGQAGPPNFETTTYAYDSDGNLTALTAPPTTNGGPNQTTTNTYNSAGELASQTTGSGQAGSTISYCYDPAGQVTSMVYPDGNQAAVAPCNSNPASYPWIVDPTAYPAQGASQTTYSYDSLGELASVTRPATTAAPNGATTAFTYDPAGDKLTAKDPNGVTATMTYSPNGSETGISYSGSSAHSVTYGYDADGNQTAMADGSGSSSYIYDPFGEQTSATNGAGQQTQYGYNPDGAVTSITYPLPAGATWAATSTVNYTFDHASMLTSVTDFNGHQITIGSTADGQPNSITLGSTGDTITTTYDPTDSASAIALKAGNSVLQTFGYTFSPAGTILTECDAASCSQPTAAYTYDNRGRVTSMTPAVGPALSYAFDPSSNLTTLPTSASGTYDKAGELTASTLSGTTNFTYDADGQRLTAKQGSTVIASGTWNGAGEITAYSDAAANMTAASYDGNGMRTSTTITPAGGAAVTQNYVWDGDSLLMDSGKAYIYTGGDAPAEQADLATGNITYLNTDGLGSVRGTISNSGSLTGTTSYDAWGNPQTAGGLTATTPFGFAGGYTDPDGLIFLIHRYYDPQTGQFTSLDPQVDTTLQPYAYTSGNPVSQIDPTGMVPCCSGGGYESPRYIWVRDFTYHHIVSMVHSLAFYFIQTRIEQSPLGFLDPWALVKFKDQVHTGGPWDLKIYLGRENKGGNSIYHRQGEHGEWPGYARVTKDRQIFFNVWGNLAYGYVGSRAGFPGWFLHWAAEHAPGHGLVTPGNRIERQMGISMYHAHNHLGSPGDLDQAILARLGQLSRYCDAIKFPSQTGCTNGKIW
jgi:RHS repeat-associated protein